MLPGSPSGRRPARLLVIGAVVAGHLRLPAAEDRRLRRTGAGAGAGAGAVRGRVGAGRDRLRLETGEGEVDVGGWERGWLRITPWL